MAAEGGAGGPAPAAAAPTSSSLENYEVVQVIGKGSFGTVSKIRRKADGRILVWKELNYGSMREKEKQLVVSEVNILRDLRHPFIVRYYDRIIDKAATRLYIVMEYCEGGDLGAIIKKCRKEGTSVEEEFIWKVFTQITVALKECHRHKEANGKTKPILHRDLKPGNIFLDAAANIKIGDFGLAKELASESKFAYTNVGTPFYMSPEMINESRYNEKSDIWALGCLLFELAALVPPFEATNHLSLAVKINAGKFNRVPIKYSEDLHRAIRWMLNVDSTKRPTVEELEKLPRIRACMEKVTPVIRDFSVAAAAAAAAAKPRTAGSKEEELARREAEVARREAAISAAEKTLREREAALQARYAELQRREAVVAAEEAKRAATVFARPPAAPAVPAANVASTTGTFVPAMPPTFLLHRAHSAGDVLAHLHSAPSAAAAAPSTTVDATLRRARAAPTGTTASTAGIPTVSLSIANMASATIPTTSINLAVGPSTGSDTTAAQCTAMDTDAENHAPAPIAAVPTARILPFGSVDVNAPQLAYGNAVPGGVKLYAAAAAAEPREEGGTAAVAFRLV